MDALYYLLLVNIYLVMFYGFYALFLKDETFFKLNRIYLVGGACMSFLIPFLQSEWIRSLFITKQVEEVTQNITMTFSQQAIIIPVEEQGFTSGELILFIYLAGAGLFLLRFLWRLYRVQSILKTGANEDAFSFFKTVKVGSLVPDPVTVYEHELVHARQWHSADVILFEILTIVNWFNPVVYLYRKAIKYIHEFTADEIACRQLEDKSTYAELLLSKTFGVPAQQLTNSFYNHSLLKQRIIMLHKSKSTRNALLKYGLSAPLFAAMMVLSSATISNKVEAIDETLNQGSEMISSIADSADDLSPLAGSAPSVAVSDEGSVTFKDEKGISTVPMTDTLPDKIVFKSVEISPEFPGGMKAFYEYLKQNFKYPEAARQKRISGRIILQFVVERDGELSDIKILRGLGSGLDEEAVKILKNSPKWKPGIQNGKAVRVAYTLPMALNEPREKTTSSIHISNDSLHISGVSESALYIVDGKEVKSNVVKTLNPKSIKVVNVLNKESASKKYGQKGNNGVIEVYVNTSPPNVATTTSGSGNITVQSGDMVLKASSFNFNSPGASVASDGQKSKSVSITASGSQGTGADTISGDATYEALVIVNGKEAVNHDGKAISRIKPNDIESINVLKGEAAIKEYGSKAKNGVIQITLKKK